MSELEEFKQKLSNAIAKSLENFVTVWSDDLSESVQGIVLDDVDDIKYNGWFDDIVEMISH